MRVRAYKVSVVLAFCAGALLLSTSPVAAQGGVGFGVVGGLTRATFTGDGVSDFVEGRNGLMGGIWFGGNRNGVVGVMGELDYVVKKVGLEGTDQEVELRYLEIPVLLRINIGQENRNTGVLGYGLVGPVFDIKIDDLGFNIAQEYEGLDIGIMAGAGIEVSRVGFEVRGNWGLREIIDGNLFNAEKIKTFTLEALIKLRLN